MKDPKVFSDSYQLALTLFHRTKSFSKFLRPTLGRRLEDASISLLVYLKEASVYTAKLRLSKLRNASGQLDEIRLLMQLAKDLDALSAGSYGEVSELTSEIGREIGGFIRHEKRNAK